MTIPGVKTGTRTIKAIGAATVQGLANAGIPAEKHGEKLRSLWWLAPAGFFMLLAIAFAGVAMSFGIRNELSFLKAIILLVPVGLCFFVAIFCAAQASSEGLNNAIAAVLTLGRGARGIVKGEGSGG